MKYFKKRLKLSPLEIKMTIRIKLSIIPVLMHEVFSYDYYVKEKLNFHSSLDWKFCLYVVDFSFDNTFEKK